MTAARRSFVPRAQSTDRRFFGVVEGVVVDVIDPDKEGRVKVRFPWFDEDMVTEYCRVRQFYAGNGYGAFFVPEPGDEVLVAFIHGDMRMPVILGGLYNGEDKPPSDRQKTKDQKMIRTKAGHTLIFDDYEKKVTLASNAGHFLELDDAGDTVTLTTKGGQKIIFEGGSATITAEATNVTVSATNVTVKASNVAVQSGHVELGNGASEPVILGTTFAACFATHVHTSNIPGLPTSPPVVPMPPNALSTQVMAG
jgi:phage baseplate assembly protein V